MAMSYDKRPVERANDFEKQFDAIEKDPRTRLAYALADVTGVPLDAVQKHGAGFVQYVIDESLNNPTTGRFAKHADEISALFDKSNPEAEMQKLAHAFSAIRHERYPGLNHETLAGSGQSPEAFITTGQGAKDIGTRRLLEVGIEAARTERHFQELAVYVGDASGRFEHLRERLEQKASERGVSPYPDSTATVSLPSLEAEPTAAVTARRPSLDKEFAQIVADPKLRTAYALADIVGVPRELMEKKGEGFVQWVLDESLNSNLGQFTKHNDEIRAIFDKSNPEKEMLKLAHAFSALRAERYPSWEWEKLETSGQAPVGYIMTGQGSKDVGMMKTLEAAIGAARTEQHFRELGCYVNDASGRFERFRETLVENAAKYGIDPFERRGLSAD